MLIGELLRSASAMRTGTAAGAASAAASGLHGRRQVARNGRAPAADALFRYGQLATTAALLEASDILRQAIDWFFPAVFGDGAAVPLRLIEGLADAARRQLEQSRGRPTANCGGSGR